MYDVMAAQKRNDSTEEGYMYMYTHVLVLNDETVIC